MKSHLLKVFVVVVILFTSILTASPSAPVAPLACRATASRFWRRPSSWLCARFCASDNERTRSAIAAVCEAQVTAFVAVVVVARPPAPRDLVTIDDVAGCLSWLAATGGIGDEPRRPEPPR